MKFLLAGLLSALPLAALLAQPFYTGAYGGSPHCQACHSSTTPPTNQFSSWNATVHGSAYDSHPELQWNSNCLPCHTTGWNLSLANHGFDDYFFSGDTLGMMQRRNVQCESCHGPTDQIPHPSTTVVDYHAEVCRNCHSGLPARHTYEEWASCRHGDVASPATQQLACAKCHEAISANAYLSTGAPPWSLPQNPIWQVTCVACHATHTRNAFTAQTYLPGDSLCRTCHTMDGAVVGEVPHATQKEMVMGPGFGGFEWTGYVYNNSCHETYLPEPCIICHMSSSAFGTPDTTTGHQVTPSIQTCALAGCHQMQIPPDSSFNIEGCQTEIDSLVGVLAVSLAQTDTTSLEYAQAKFDYDFVVNDGSRGVHNFFYSRDLLMSSIEGLAGASSVTITLTPVNPPIQIPATGGSFNYTATVLNTSSAIQTFNAWIMIQLPSGLWYGPVLGPLSLTLPAGVTISRLRTQTIPGSAPPGNYAYEGRVGVYPSTIWNTGSFPFTKLASGGIEWVNGWGNQGEAFIDGGESGFLSEGGFGASVSPNPFNPSTSFNFILPAARWVKLSVFDITGRPLGKSALLNTWLEAGTHTVAFDGSDLPSGIYLYRLQAGEWAATGKLVLLK